jgi:hypothetical protein
MDVKDYRKAYEAELAAGAPADAQASLSANAALGVAHDADLAQTIPALLATLGDAAKPISTRVAALKAISARRFLGDQFAPYRVDFLNMLRQIAQPGIDPQLCARALAILAAEKDSAAQDLLRRGLQQPQSALVPAATALHLLGFDDHANLAELARDVFQKTTELAAKEAALRVLATDAKSQDLFAQLLTDKAQPRSLRALSATGLNLLNPQRFAELAQNIVKDHSDFEDIRASALGALVDTPLHQVVRDNAGLLDEIKNLSAQTPLTNLRAAAGRFLAKH